MRGQMEAIRETLKYSRETSFFLEKRQSEKPVISNDTLTPGYP